jgi:hypothetical protein
VRTPDHDQVNLRLTAAMLDRVQQGRVEPRVASQFLGIRGIILLLALAKVWEVMGVGHDHFMAKTRRQLSSWLRSIDE